MSILFTCPNCLGTVRADDGLAGHTTTCPGCKGRLQVPGRPVATTIDPTSVPTTLYLTAETPPESDSILPLEDRPQRASFWRRHRGYLLELLCLAVGVTAAILISEAMREPPPQPRPDEPPARPQPATVSRPTELPGQDWTVGDVAGHLRQKGILLKRVPTAEDQAGLFRVEGQEGLLVHIARHPSEQTARAMAEGRVWNSCPALAWGRFTISSTDAECLKTISKALTGKPGS